MCSGANTTDRNRSGLDLGCAGTRQARPRTRIALIVPQEQLAPAPEEADLQALAILPLLVHDDVDGTEGAI